MTFKEVRDEYERQRENQRKCLASFLSEHKELQALGLQVITGTKAGKGSEYYTSHGRIPAYDLRNWKWVEVKGAGGFDAIISLNMPDIDPRTKNIHSLYDRIGIILAPGDWIYTAIDLPLNDTEKGEIAQLVLDCFRKYSAGSN